MIYTHEPMPTYVDHLTILNKYTAGLRQARSCCPIHTVEDIQNLMEHVISTVDEVGEAMTYAGNVQRMGRKIFSIGVQTNTDIQEGV
jgi:hypothetical protein